MRRLEVKVLDERIRGMLPRYATAGAAGLDLRACLAPDEVAPATAVVGPWPGAPVACTLKTASFPKVASRATGCWLMRIRAFTSRLQIRLVSGAPTVLRTMTR